MVIGKTNPYRTKQMVLSDKQILIPIEESLSIRENQPLSGKPTLIPIRIGFPGKPTLIGKTNPYRENQSLSGKPILIGKNNPYRENQFLSGKPILIPKTNPYRDR